MDDTKLKSLCETYGELLLDGVSYPFKTNLVGFDNIIIQNNDEHIGLVKALMQITKCRNIEKGYNQSIKRIRWSDINGS